MSDRTFVKRSIKAFYIKKKIIFVHITHTMSINIFPNCTIGKYAINGTIKSTNHIHYIAKKIYLKNTYKKK